MRWLLPYPLLVLLACQGGQGPAEAQLADLRGELSQLRTEMGGLSARLEAFERASARPEGAPRPDPAPAQVQRSSIRTRVRWAFEVRPEGAEISVDGQPVVGKTWYGPHGSTARLVRVRKTGYRTAEQRVRPEADRTLRYQLVPGRGVQHLGSAPVL